MSRKYAIEAPGGLNNLLVIKARKILKDESRSLFTRRIDAADHLACVVGDTEEALAARGVQSYLERDMTTSSRKVIFNAISTLDDIIHLYTSKCRAADAWENTKKTS